VERGAGQGGGEVRGVDWVCGGSGRVGEEWTVMMREIGERGAGDRFGFWWFQEAVISLYTQKVATPLLVVPPPEKPKTLKHNPTQ